MRRRAGLPVHHLPSVRHADAFRPRAQLPPAGQGREARERRGVRRRPGVRQRELDRYSTASGAISRRCRPSRRTFRIRPRRRRLPALVRAPLGGDRGRRLGVVLDPVLHGVQRAGGVRLPHQPTAPQAPPLPAAARRIGARRPHQSGRLRDRGRSSATLGAGCRHSCPAVRRPPTSCTWRPVELASSATGWIWRAARRDLVLPDARLGARLVGDHRAPAADARGRVARPSRRLEALVALSRDRERLHRPLPLDVPRLRQRGQRRRRRRPLRLARTAGRATRSAAWVSEAIRGSALLVRGADPEWSAGSSRPGRASSNDRMPSHRCCRLRIRRAGPPPPFAANSDGSHGGSSARRALEWVASRLRQRAAPRMPSSSCTHTARAPRRRDLRSRAARAAIAGWPSGRARARGPPRSWRAATALSRACCTASGGRTRSPPTSRGGIPAVPPQHGQRARPTRHSAGRQPQARAPSTSSAAPSSTSTVSVPSTARDRTWLVPHGPAGMLLAARYRAGDRLRDRLPRRHPTPLLPAWG